MKKIFLILLSCLTAVSLFACTSEKQEDEPKVRPPHWWGVTIHEVFIQAEDGTHKCLWEDGNAVFDNSDNPSPEEVDIDAKHASLSLYIEYDMWFDLSPNNIIGKDCLDFTNDYWYAKFDYDKTKFEIKDNPEKENHFIITALQSCDNEKINFTLREMTPTEHILGKMIEPVEPMNLWTFSITVSTPITIVE